MAAFEAVAGATTAIGELLISGCSATGFLVGVGLGDLGLGPGVGVGVGDPNFTDGEVKGLNAEAGVRA